MTRASPQPVPACDLRIDELVLDGFPPSERHAIAAAMERELARLLTGPNAPFAAQGSGMRTLIAADRIDGGVVALAPGASPQRVGIEAARAIGRNLGALVSPGGTLSPGGRRS